MTMTTQEKYRAAHEAARAAVLSLGTSDGPLLERLRAAWREGFVGVYEEWLPPDAVADYREVDATLRRALVPAPIDASATALDVTALIAAETELRSAAEAMLRIERALAAAVAGGQVSSQ
jgi:hydroxypyruvate isomerase